MPLLAADNLLRTADGVDTESAYARVVASLTAKLTESSEYVTTTVPSEEAIDFDAIAEPAELVIRS